MEQDSADNSNGRRRKALDETKVAIEYIDQDGAVRRTDQVLIAHFVDRRDANGDLPRGMRVALGEMGPWESRSLAMVAMAKVLHVFMMNGLGPEQIARLAEEINTQAIAVARSWRDSPAE